MNRDSIIHEIWQCEKCGAIWEGRGIGRVVIAEIDRMFCRTCGCEDLRRVSNED